MILAILMQAAVAATTGDLGSESTHDLAARTFATPPPDIVSHAVRIDPSPSFAPAIAFFTAARPFGDGVCRRIAYHVPGKDIGHRTARVIEKPQLALATDCATVEPENFAWVQPATAMADAATMLRWLADRQRRGGDADVACLPSHIMPDPCARGAAATLRALPLDRLYIIDRGARGGEWNLSVMPTGPGSLYYSVRLTRTRFGTPAITISWDAPAPF